MNEQSLFAVPRREIAKPAKAIYKKYFLHHNFFKHSLV
jgi:hypothetical protein